MSTFLTEIKKSAKSFCSEIKTSSETGYLALLLLYMCVFYVEKINWVVSEELMQTFSLVLEFSAMLASASFLIYIIVRWKYPWQYKAFYLVPAVVLFALPILLNLNMYNTWYLAFTDIFFCLMAYGKDYKKILRCYMLMAFACLFVAAIGLPLGLTRDRWKLADDSGFSLGIIYPNTWGQITFLVLIIFWYLYLQKKVIATFAVFIATSLFMFFVPSCKTVAVLAAVFPFFTMLTNHCKKTETRKTEAENNRPHAARALLTAFPFLCFGLTMFFCWQMDFVKKYTYGTGLETLGLRFVQGGIAFQHYGFPLIGYPIPYDSSVVSVVNGVEETLYILDNAFITFSLFRGAIWMLWALSWLSFANWKGLKNKDYGLVLLGVFLMIFALVERPGLMASYNFMFLYPLAGVAYLQEPEEKLSLRSLFSFENKLPEKIETKGKNKKNRRCISHVPAGDISMGLEV